MPALTGHARRRQSTPVLGPSQLREATGAYVNGGEDGVLAERVSVWVRVTQAEGREAEAKSTPGGMPATRSLRAPW